eukprot:267380-Rhodomonas_salina.1
MARATEHLSKQQKQVVTVKEALDAREILCKTCREHVDQLLHNSRQWETAVLIREKTMDLKEQTAMLVPLQCTMQEFSLQVKEGLRAQSDLRANSELLSTIKELLTKLESYDVVERQEEEISQGSFVIVKCEK